MGTEFDEGSEILDRRQAIKKAAVGAAAAGVVWSAPKIEGLSLRPNYAAAASGADVSVPVTLTAFSAPLVGTLVVSGTTYSYEASVFPSGNGEASVSVNLPLVVNAITTSQGDFATQNSGGGQFVLQGHTPALNLPVTLSVTFACA